VLNEQIIAVIIPAFNAAQTLPKLLREIPYDIVDEVILGDDASTDETLAVAADHKVLKVVRSVQNRGYGANQKACYEKALALGADIVIMLHGDYQYTPRLTRAMVAMVADGVYPVVFASRMLGKGARLGGMPWYRFFANRFLTALQNFLMNTKLSEYHTGFRCFSARVLEEVPLKAYSDSFFFDNQLAVGIIARGFQIGEISCPTRYAGDSSSIPIRAAAKYALQVIWLSLRYRASRFTGRLWRD
jgi:glycosyltransferase involved in cell wall biosynthesis